MAADRTLKTEYRKRKTSKETKNKEIKACYARQELMEGRREAGKKGGSRPSWSSKEEHRADALALRAEERRDKLRKAAGSGKYTMIRRYLNGETHAGRACVSITEQRQKCLNRLWRGTRRTETSK